MHTLISDLQTHT